MEARTFRKLRNEASEGVSGTLGRLYLGKSNGVGGGGGERSLSVSEPIAGSPGDGG